MKHAPVMVALILAILASLPGCAFQRAAEARRARIDLVGLSRSALLACAGPPAQQFADGGAEYWTYSSTGRGVTAMVPVGSTGLYGGVTRQRYCNATFTLQDGRVTHIRYSGETGGWATKGRACAPIIEGCL